MIEVNFFDACQDCHYIDAISHTEIIRADNNIVEVKTLVTCKYIDICKRVSDYENNNNVGGYEK